VMTKEAKQVQDMVPGMFLTNSDPAAILFYLGASHSFIT
jgi:hypothetical protein